MRGVGRNVRAIRVISIAVLFVPTVLALIFFLGLTIGLQGPPGFSWRPIIAWIGVVVPLSCDFLAFTKGGPFEVVPPSWTVWRRS